MPKDQFTVGTPDERIDRLMRVAVSESSQQHVTLVGTSVSVRVLQKQHVRVLTHINTAVAKFDACRNVESLSKHRRLVSISVRVSVLQQDDLVVGEITGTDVRVRGGHRDIHPSVCIPAKIQRRRQAVCFGREQIDLQFVSRAKINQFPFDIGVSVPMQDLRFLPPGSRILSA